MNKQNIMMTNSHHIQQEEEHNITLIQQEGSECINTNICHSIPVYMVLMWSNYNNPQIHKNISGSKRGIPTYILDYIGFPILKTLKLFGYFPKHQKRRVFRGI